VKGVKLEWTRNFSFYPFQWGIKPERKKTMTEYELKKLLSSDKLFQLDKILYKYRKDTQTTYDIFEILEILLHERNIKKDVLILENKHARLCSWVFDLERKKNELEEEVNGLEKQLVSFYEKRIEQLKKNLKKEKK
jgi:anionic cell wall polymer biosynthesis LytR-Cps2A-Psr (LCP) family protein